MNGHLLSPDEIRRLLRAHNHVAVHFSTIMADHEFYFPDDIRNAMRLSGQALAFSTITPGDTGPHEGPGGGEGEIGLLVDFSPDTKVLGVGRDDIGSFDGGSLGRPPTAHNCSDSIQNRNLSNEWLIENYVPIGIYILGQQCLVRQRGGGERFVTRDEILCAFPDERIFSHSRNSFLELDRQTFP